MKLRDFIRIHREEIDKHILSVLVRPRERNLCNRDRMQWIRNDETLYQWAKNEGVTDL